MGPRVLISGTWYKLHLAGPYFAYILWGEH